MSHETRTPLTVILGLVRQLKQENAALTIKQAESMLSAIERNSLILLRQVNHMLRLERRRDIKVETALPLVPLTSLLINAFLPIAQEKNIALEFDASSIPPKLGLMVRQEDYESMVMNLLSNAIKYSGGGGCVVVSLQQVDSHELLLAVSDTGIGIAPEDQERIF